MYYNNKRNDFIFKKDIFAILNRQKSYRDFNLKDYCIKKINILNLKNTINKDEKKKIYGLSKGITHLYKNNKNNNYNRTFSCDFKRLYNNNNSKNNKNNNIIISYASKNTSSFLNDIKYITNYNNKFKLSGKRNIKKQNYSISERKEENKKENRNDNFLFIKNEGLSKTNIDIYNKNIFNKNINNNNINKRNKIKIFNDYLKMRHKNIKNNFTLDQKRDVSSHFNIKINNKNKDKIIIDSNEEKDKKTIKAYGIVSQPGKLEKNVTKTNQDNFIIFTNINNKKNLNIFGVLDGHGINGHLVSNYVSKYIKNAFMNNEEIKSCNSYEEIYSKLKNKNYKIINDIFINAEKELHTVNFDCNFSGTTAIIIFEIDNFLISANVGDSRAILIYSNINNSLIETMKETNKIYNLSYNNIYQIKNIMKPCSEKKTILSYSYEKDRKSQLKSLTNIFHLSRDQKPTIQSEKMRINRSGGIVERSTDRNGVKSGPFRVWVKNGHYPGIAMSRSIGDFVASSIGVIPIPEITEYRLDNNSRYMVICTDGIWDYISNEKVMDIGNKFYPNNSPEDFCNELVKQATYFWEKNNVVVDDITVLAVYF